MINDYTKVMEDGNIAYAESQHKQGPWSPGKWEDHQQSHLWALITKGILIQKLSRILKPEKIVYEPKTQCGWPINKRGFPHLEIFEVNATGLALIGRFEKPVDAWDAWDHLRRSYSGDENYLYQTGEILGIPYELIRMVDQLERGRIGSMWVGDRPLGLILKSLRTGTFSVMHREIFNGTWKPNTNYC